MKQFTDNKGRKWDVSINVAAIKKVRDLCNLDLMQVVEDKNIIGKLIEDPVLLVDVVYAVCCAQAKAQSISEEDFGEGMAGDAIDGAAQALLEELVGFFPQAKRGPLRKAVQTMRALEAEGMRRVEKMLDDPTLMQRMNAELDAELARLGSFSTGTPESPE